MKQSMTGVGVLLLLVVAAHAENWPGLNGGGTAANSCPTAIGTNINVKWMLRLDPQTYNSRGGGAMRSKNMVLRDGEIALLAPGSASTDLAFYDAALGGFKRAFPSTLLKTGNAEWNPTGIEGRDLRNGQHLVYWHSNGNVYCRSHGDNMQRVVLRASDGALQPNVGALGSNQSGYFLMSDNSIWHLTSGGGHQGQIRSFIMQDAGGTLATKSFGGADGTLYNYFTWCGSMLMDGDWVYVLGATTHPDLGWAEATTSNWYYQWLGARVRGYKVLGQTATTNNQNFVNGSNGSFAWGRTNAFIANDHDLASAVKPWCLGRSNVFVVTESATWTTNTATVDFTQPMRLSAISRTNGVEEFTLQLGITGAGCSVSPNFGNSGGGTTWRPQVAYADRTATDGREYVSILLPEAVSMYGWFYPKINPTNSNDSLNTRLSMVDAVTRTELWTYQYPHGATTPVLAQDVNTCTKQIIAGDALYVVYTKTAVPIENYISTNILTDLNLYVDRFTLADGAKTSFVFPLGVQANTMQLDDLAAANGKLYALITYREWPYHAVSWPYASPAPNGAQALVALGAVTPGNTAPVFSQAPAASSTNITPPVVSVTLTARATDSVTPSLAWNRLTGPAAIFFSTNNSAAATNVTCTFQKAGTYLIECRASDGDLSVTGTVQVTVNNPATTVKVEATDATASEPGLGDGTGTFRLTRTGGGTNVPMTVNVALTGTASNGVDYVTVSNTVEIPAGATNATVSVDPLDDALIEGPESVTLTIQPAALAYLVGTPDDATVTINDDDIPATNVAPVASNLVITLDEDTPAAVTLAATDENGDSLTYTVLTSPSHGMLSGTVPDLTYTPALNYYGPDLFTYRANDPYVPSAIATGTITVVSVNDPPLAEAQSVTVANNTPKAITLGATDVEGGSLTYAIGTGPAHGELSGSAPSLTYTPSNNYSGPDSFTFTASDSASTSAAATVSITVYPPGYYAARNGRFNASDVDTWDKGLGVYPTNSGDIAYISTYTVTASNVGEVAAGVVDISAGGVLKLAIAANNTTNTIQPNALVNVNTGGLLWVGTKQICNHSNVVNGGTLALPGGSGNPFGGVVTVAADSVISNSISSAASIDLRSATHGGGKLTLKGLNTPGSDSILLASSSTWTGNWDVADNVQVRFGTTSYPQSVPRGIRVGSGTIVNYNLTATIKGTLSGAGTNRVYQGGTFTIGTVTNRGVVSPGDVGVNGGIGTLTLTSYSPAAGKESPTLAFSSNSLYEVEMTGAASYDCVKVAGAGVGTGKVTIAAGATLNVALWTPTNSVTLDATIIDTAMTNGSNGLLTGSFSTVNWSNTTGWSNLMVTAIDNDLHITGVYTVPAGNPDSNGNGIPDEWEQQVFGNLTNSATGDNDGDGLDNFGEWVAGTHPTNVQSALKFTNLVQNAGSGRVLSWYSESNRFYTLGLSSNLLLDPFSSKLTNRMPANPPVNVYTDFVERSGASFYRVTVTNQ